MRKKSIKKISKKKKLLKNKILVDKPLKKFLIIKMLK